MADTFATYVETGTTRGVAFRFVIEGCPFEFVDDVRMERELADGRIRVRGLKRDSIGIRESAILHHAELELSMPSIQIEETAGPYRDAATQAFTSWVGASNRTWLAAPVLVGDTSIEVRDTSGITAGDVIHPGTEAMLVDSVDSATELSVERGIWRTTAQAFQTEIATTFGLELDLIPVGSQPACYAGRRCWLYGHGLDELQFEGEGEGAGTVLWRGVLTADPDLADATTWNVSIASRLDILNAKVGSEKNGETQLRGIYYPDSSPFFLTGIRQSGANRSDAYDSTWTFQLSGFFETQEAWCSALTTYLRAQFAFHGLTGAMTARVEGDRWNLYYQTGATPKFIQFYDGSPVDGWCQGTLHTSGATGGIEVATVAATTEYRVTMGAVGPEVGHLLGDFHATDLAVPFTEVRKVPRACYVDWIGTVLGGSWPMFRWYLDRSGGFPASGSMIITPPASEADPEPLPLPTITIVTNDAAGYVEADPVERREWGAAGTAQPTIDVAIRFNIGTGQDLGGFISSLISQSPGLCNTGVMPLITSDDFDTSEIIAVVALVMAGAPWYRFRDYAFAKPQKLLDVLTQEARWYGLFWCLSAAGKITLRQLTPAVDVPATHIDSTRHAPGEGDFGSVRMSPDGMLGSVLYKYDYDPREDKHTGEANIIARGVQATLRGKAQTLEIAPVVNPSGSWPEPAAIALRFASLLALYGSRRYVYDLPVTMHLHSLRVGDGVLVTIRQLPYVGQRGSTTENTGLVLARGRVIARAWDYGNEPRGTLSVEVHGLDIAGYSPTARVGSASHDIPTDLWDVTIDDDAYGPGGDIDDGDYFLVGMRVKVVKWDTDTPAEYPGVITANDFASFATLTINFDGVFPGVGGDTWNIRFDDSDEDLTVAQRRYAFIAYADGHIDEGADSRVARIFA